MRWPHDGLQCWRRFTDLAVEAPKTGLLGEPPQIDIFAPTRATAKHRVFEEFRDQPLEGSVVGVALELVRRDPALNEVCGLLAVVGELRRQFVERLAAELQLPAARLRLLIRDHGGSFAGISQLAQERCGLDPQSLRLSKGADGIEKARQTAQVVEVFRISPRGGLRLAEEIATVSPPGRDPLPLLLGLTAQSPPLMEIYQIVP